MVIKVTKSPSWRNWTVTSLTSRAFGSTVLVSQWYQLERVIKTYTQETL